jgi:hypothetical protein
MGAHGRDADLDLILIGGRERRVARLRPRGRPVPEYADAKAELIEAILNPRRG